MKMWHLAFAISLAFNPLFISCKSSKNVYDKKGMYRETWQALKDYAYCQCIATAFRQDSIDVQKRDVSVPVIYELASYSFPLETRQLLDSAAYAYALNIKKLQPADYGGKRAILLSCLDFYRSKELKKLSEKRIK